MVKNSSTYWEGNAEAESLQRIYGISFPDNKLMKEWKVFQEEAAKRDHRKIGNIFTRLKVLIYGIWVKFLREDSYFILNQ